MPSNSAVVGPMAATQPVAAYSVGFTPSPLDLLYMRLCYLTSQNLLPSKGSRRGGNGSANFRFAASSVLLLRWTHSVKNLQRTISRKCHPGHMHSHHLDGNQQFRCPGSPVSDSGNGSSVGPRSLH